MERELRSPGARHVPDCLNQQPHSEAVRRLDIERGRTPALGEPGAAGTDPLASDGGTLQGNGESPRLGGSLRWKTPLRKKRQPTKLLERRPKWPGRWQN